MFIMSNTRPAPNPAQTPTPDPERQESPDMSGESPSVSLLDTLEIEEKDQNFSTKEAVPINVWVKPYVDPKTNAMLVHFNHEGRGLCTRVCSPKNLDWMISTTLTHVYGILLFTHKIESSDTLTPVVSDWAE